MRDPKLRVTAVFSMSSVAEADELYKKIKTNLAKFPGTVFSADISLKPDEPS